MADINLKVAVSFFIAMASVFVGLASSSSDRFFFRRRPDYDALFLKQPALPSLPSSCGKLECIKLCIPDWSCKSVLHNTETQECRLYSIHFPSSPGTSPESWQLWERTDSLCPVSRGYVYHRYTGLCYKIHRDVALKWTAANTLCQQEGGHLLVIDSQEKQDLMKKELTNVKGTATFGEGGRQGFYLDGLYSRGKWAWPSRGEPVVFSAWFNTESARNNVETRIIMYRDESYLWASVNQNFTRPFVCEIDVSAQTGKGGC